MTTDTYPDLNDITIRSRDLTDAPGLSLIVIVRNEATLLPDFLSHYRALGIKRFFVLDDKSDDGTADILAAQPDVCLLESKRRYGETPRRDELAKPLQGKANLRMVHAWRSWLMNRCVGAGWSTCIRQR